MEKTALRSFIESMKKFNSLEFQSRPRPFFLYQYEYDLFEEYYPEFLDQVNYQVYNPVLNLGDIEMYERISRESERRIWTMMQERRISVFGRFKV